MKNTEMKFTGLFKTSLPVECKGETKKGRVLPRGRRKFTGEVIHDESNNWEYDLKDPFNGNTYFFTEEDWMRLVVKREVIPLSAN